MHLCLGKQTWLAWPGRTCSWPQPVLSGALFIWCSVLVISACTVCHIWHYECAAALHLFISVSCVGNARFCLLRLKLVTWFLFSYASRDRYRERGGEIWQGKWHCVYASMRLSIRAACVCLRQRYCQSIRVSSLSSQQFPQLQSMYFSISLIASTHTLHTHSPCVCIECTFAVGHHPQGQSGAQSEHFSHSLLYSLAFTCEHDNKTPFVRRQRICLAFPHLPPSSLLCTIIFSVYFA